MSRGNHCSQSHLYPSWTVLHSHYPNWPGAHQLQTKDTGMFICLPGWKILWRCSKTSVENSWVLMNVTVRSTVNISSFLSILFGFSGCVFHGTGFYIHDNEPNFHRAWLDEWRKAKSRWPLNCSPQVLQEKGLTASPFLHSSEVKKRFNLLLEVLLL